jgi:hypothetical protein
MLSLLHFVPASDDPAGVIAHYRDAVVSGSYLAISHVGLLPRPSVEGERILTVYEQVGTPLTPRTEAELTALLRGFELMEPGLVAVHLWRPEDVGEPADGSDDILSGFRAAVGRKP